MTKCNFYMVLTQLANLFKAVFFFISLSETVTQLGRPTKVLNVFSIASHTRVLLEWRTSGMVVGSLS